MVRENRRTIARLLGISVLITILAPFVVHTHPGLVAADQSYVVQSGSMEPNLPVGALVFVNTDVSAEEIEEGDVITFTKGRETITTTHRVHEKRIATIGEKTSISFTTKGDANEKPDSERVYRDELVGRLMFSIPYVGHVVVFLGTDLGWFTLVVVPVALLFVDGLVGLYGAIEMEKTDE